MSVEPSLFIELSVLGFEDVMLLLAVMISNSLLLAISLLLPSAVAKLSGSAISKSIGLPDFAEKDNNDASISRLTSTVVLILFHSTTHDFALFLNVLTLL